MPNVYEKRIHKSYFFTGIFFPNFMLPSDLKLTSLRVLVVSFIEKEFDDI